MKPTWHRADGMISGTDDPTPGTLNIYWNYNLCCWSFGVRFEPDPCWFSLYLDFGPIELSFTYWRTYGAVIRE